MGYLDYRDEKYEEKYIKEIAPYLRDTGIKNMQVNGKTSEDLENILLNSHAYNT